MATKTLIESPLIIITGPTASGKSGVAIEIAKRINGEIISADSRTIYRDLDIGTAKPTIDEQEGIPHWGLDLVDPSERYTAADFKAYAQQKIIEIRERGNVPILVGGTGLYVSAVLFDYQFGSDVDSERRRQLETMELDELYAYCYKNNIKLPENYKNKRYVIRAIEMANEHADHSSTPIKNVIVVGIATDKEILRERIAARTEQLFERGVVEEAKKLGKKYGWNNEAMTGNIYPILHAYLDNELSLEEVKTKFNILDWRLAKRQLTWLRRNEYITWLPLEQVIKYVLDRLAK